MKKSAMKFISSKHKTIVLIILLAFMGDFVYGQTSNSIYSDSLVGQGNKVHHFQKFKGKKILLMVLPSVQNDSSTAMLKTINSIALNYKGRVQIIGVPSYELGYKEDSINNLMKWYQLLLDSSIIITKPVYTNRSSREQQNVPFYWLTHSSQNKHFYNEIGSGMLFLIDEEGNMKGTLGIWNEQMLNMILQSN